MIVDLLEVSVFFWWQLGLVVIRKQRAVARSSTKSEYRALAQVAAELTWVQSLLKELQLSLPRSPIVWYDSISAAALAANPVLHSRSKHIEINVHFIRDKVA